MTKVTEVVAWKCDNCNMTVPSMHLPDNWLEVSMFKKFFIHFSFCTFKCLSEWATSHEEYKKELDNEIKPV